MTATAELKLAMRQTRLQRMRNRLEERAMRALELWATVGPDSKRWDKAKAGFEEHLRALQAIKDELAEVSMQLRAHRDGRAA